MAGKTSQGLKALEHCHIDTDTDTDIDIDIDVPSLHILVTLLGTCSLC